jgi:DNA-cytosine methyltransferase
MKLDELRTIKVGSDFSGVGAFNQALQRIGIKYEEIFACDMDKFARQTFIHNYGEPKYYPTNVYEREIPTDSLDIYMTSPPCQAFSLAGKRLGKDDKRGILFFNSLEFIEKNKPRFFIFENVKGLLSDDSGKTFQEWLNLLGGKSVNGAPVIFPYEDAVPYHLYWKVLNAKNYGVPQNRERVFLIGIRDDSDNIFSFPIEEHLSKRLKDVLEEEVFEKYFLSNKMLKVLETHKNPIISKENPDHSGSILASYFKMGGRDQQYIKSSLEKYYLSEKMISHLEKHDRSQEFISQDTVSVNCITANYAKQSSDLQYLKTELPLFEENTQNQDLTHVRNSISSNNSLDSDVIVHNIPEIVRVRKHEVDIKGLQECLTAHRTKKIKQIAEELGVPKTEAEHWFRTDKYFAIPNAEIWFQLKECLNITTTEFDSSIMDFIEKEGVFEKSNRVYDENGISPTMTATSSDERILTREDNISIRQKPRGNNKGADFKISPNVTSNSFEQNNHLVQSQKIRRLTPRECFRLMDFPDTFDFSVVSDSQAYKQAGNSIVVGVLEKIIRQLKIYGS